MPNKHSKKWYSWALRCTFFEEGKNSCRSKFVQLLLLNRVKVRWSKNHAAQGFHYRNSFISNFFGHNSKTCTCKVRAAWGRVSRGLTVMYNQSKVTLHQKSYLWKKRITYEFSIYLGKGEIKPQTDWCAVDSPKKQTNKFVVVFAFLLFTAKINKFVRCFFGRVYGAQICLQFYLTFYIVLHGL